MLGLIGPAAPPPPGSPSGGMTQDRLHKILNAETQKLRDAGLSTKFLFINPQSQLEENLKPIRDALSAEKYSCVMIGAGVRTFAEHTLTFEEVVNLVHRLAPESKFCFNSNPGDTAAAVFRAIDGCVTERGQPNA
uniref:Uncharacterized protein n=1 Tax=Tetraselmis sp. GSL018 TaxID=582737 RepID=A0A061RQX3_9CHLO